jgi:hypothetical protein
MGAKDDNHFVINRIGSSNPEFLIRSDGVFFRAEFTAMSSTDTGVVAMPLNLGDWIVGPPVNDYFAFQSNIPTSNEYYSTPNNPPIVPAAVDTSSALYTRARYAVVTCNSTPISREC